MSKLCNALPYIPLHEGERSFPPLFFQCFSLVFLLRFILVIFYFFFASGFPLGCFRRRLLWGCGDIQTGNLTFLILFCAKSGTHKIKEYGWNSGHGMDGRMGLHVNGCRFR